MSSANPRSKPLPKFGEWDVNNPASAEGFTVIFNKARDQKKTNGTIAGGLPPASKTCDQTDNNKQKQSTKKWLCCFLGY